MSQFTVRHGQRYSAKILLTGFKKMASNETVGARITSLGFENVIVVGRGSIRLVKGTWKGPTRTIPLPPEVKAIAEIS